MMKWVSSGIFNWKLYLFFCAPFVVLSLLFLFPSMRSGNALETTKVNVAVRPPSQSNDSMTLNASARASLLPAVLQRLTQYHPTIPDQTSIQPLQIAWERAVFNMLGGQSAWVSLKLDIIPGPSLRNRDTIVNVLLGVQGEMKIISGKKETVWHLKQDNFSSNFAKTFYDGKQLGFFIPVAIDMNADQGPLYLTITFLCSVSGSWLECGKVHLLRTPRWSLRNFEDLFNFEKLGDTQSLNSCSLSGGEECNPVFCKDCFPKGCRHACLDIGCPQGVHCEHNEGAEGCCMGAWECACMNCTTKIP